jgi:hypothetical protein
VTTIQEARPRVQRMLDHGYGFEKIEDEIEAIEGLDPEEQSALWVWAWTSDDMGRPHPWPPTLGRRAHPSDTRASRHRSRLLDS